jgi:hypothetical protein
MATQDPREPVSGTRKGAANHTADHKPAPSAATVTQRAQDHAPTHEAPRVRTRSRNAATDPNDEFYVNLAAVGPDTDVNWKRFSNVGEEYPYYIARMREQGWEPVNPQDHPDWVPVPPGYDKANIIKGGLILMERPMALTNEARAEDKQRAKQQVIEAEQRLGMTPNATLTRDHEGVKPRIQKEMMRPIAIQED